PWKVQPRAEGCQRAAGIVIPVVDASLIMVGGPCHQPVLRLDKDYPRISPAEMPRDHAAEEAAADHCRVVKMFDGEVPTQRDQAWPGAPAYVGRPVCTRGPWADARTHELPDRSKPTSLGPSL